MISKVLREQPSTKTDKPVPSVPWAPARAQSRWRGWLWLAGVALVVVVAYFTLPAAALTRVQELSTNLRDILSPAKAKAPAPPRDVPVIAGVARQGDMELYLNGLGSVTALFTVTLRCRVDGELMKINFTEGQMVHEGDLLAEIDPRPYQVQLKQAQGTLMRDEAALKVAQLDLDRYSALIGSKSITQQQLDGQKALVQQSQGAIKTDLGMIDNAKLQLIYCRITAPVSGRIGLRMVDPGNIVHASDATGLAVITQLQPIAVVFTIPQDDISRVQRRVNTGQTLEVDAYDRDFKNKLAVGKLMALDNQVDQTTGTVKLKALFKNADNMLFPNQFVNARLLVDTRHDVVIVPSAAVQRGPDSTFVYVVASDSKVELKNVVVGPSEADETVIESGLSAGENVVTDGVDKLQPGSKVVARQRGVATADAKTAAASAGSQGS